MPIEPATFISTLVEANPLGSDDRSTADDHIRLTKKVLKDSFPGINEPLTATAAELNTHEGRLDALEAAKFAKDGTNAATGDFDMATKRLKNVGTPIVPGDAPNVAWVQEYVAQAFDLIYPVGHIYMSSVNTNPADLFGVGTWEPYSQGRVIIGAGTATDSAGRTEGFAAGSVGGEYFHTLTRSELPNAPLQFNVGTSDSGTGSIALNWSGGQLRNTTAMGDGEAHNNLQPYTVAYLWRRTT